MSNTPLDATAAVEHFLAGARDGGLTHICISPGSRSTPLAVAALRTPGITTSVHLDERVAAFHGLGRARASGTTVGLICTSGTAAANYLPAVSEAGMNNVPLLVVTADRPPEHQSWGVGQTFEQNGLYHNQVRAEFSMPVGGTGGAAFSQRAGWRAALTTIDQHGPVHVNWPFRLPLEPAGEAIDPPLALGNVDLDAQKPIAKILMPREVADLQVRLRAASRPLIIAGPQSPLAQPDRTEANRLGALAAATNIPILADALSGLRGPEMAALVQSPALVLAQSAATVEALTPDLIIRIGQTPTAKAQRLWWEDHPCPHLLIDPLNEWNDPSHLSAQRYRSDPIALLTAALGEIGDIGDSAYYQRWLAAGETAAAAVERVLAAEDGDGSNDHTGLAEPQIAQIVTASASPDDHIVVSSSLPVRDVDTFGGVDCPAAVSANRGINGIDGVISTAAGIAAAAGVGATTTSPEGHTVVLIGDVALMHDLGGVLDAARNETLLIIVVPNNDGGGIFSMLPAKQALDDDTFSTLFTTSHGADFSFLGGYPGVAYEHCGDLSDALKRAKSDPRAPVTILEVTTSTEHRLVQLERLHDELNLQ